MKYFIRPLNAEQWRERREQIVAVCAEKAAQAKERLSAASKTLENSLVVAQLGLIGSLAADAADHWEYLTTGSKLGIIGQADSAGTIVTAMQQHHILLTPINLVGAQVAFLAGGGAALAYAALAKIRQGLAERALLQAEQTSAQAQEDMHPT
jgi:hypothetical protein